MISELLKSLQILTQFTDGTGPGLHTGEQDLLQPLHHQAHQQLHLPGHFHTDKPQLGQE